MKRTIAALLPAAVLIGIAAFSFSQEPATAKKPAAAPAATKEDPDVERARKLVRLLDDVYKQTIVLITDKYVHTEKDFPAGSAAVGLFANISKGGSHQVRLIDATGEPYEEANVAKDDFEKEGIKRLKAGAKIHEEIVEKDGQRSLRTLTPVPVVMKKCVMCHEHYANAKPGEPIGAISYIVPIE